MIALAHEARADNELVPSDDLLGNSGMNLFEELFGDSGINTWTPSADSFLASIDPTGALAGNLDTSVDNFIHGMGPDGFTDAPFSTLASEFDPSAFTSSVEQFGPSDYVSVLIPQDAAGDVALGLDLIGFDSGLDTLGFDRRFARQQPRPSDHDAPLGPRRGGDRQAHTLDPARDGPPRPGQRSQLSRDALSRNTPDNDDDPPPF